MDYRSPVTAILSRQLLNTCRILLIYIYICIHMTKNRSPSQHLTSSNDEFFNWPNHDHGTTRHVTGKLILLFIMLCVWTKAFPNLIIFKPFELFFQSHCYLLNCLTISDASSLVWQLAKMPYSSQGLTRKYTTLSSYRKVFLSAWCFIITNTFRLTCWQRSIYSRKRRKFCVFDLPRSFSGGTPSQSLPLNMN